MAGKKDAWSRFREKENERDDSLREEMHKALGEREDDPGQTIKDGQKTTREMRDRSAEQNPLIRLIQRADLMLEQVQHLFGMYVAGVEKFPPLSQQKQLDDIIQKITSAPKNNQTILFRANQFNTKYMTYKDRWDRLLKDIESGKVVIRKQDKPKFKL